MILKLSLHSLIARLVCLALALVVCGLLASVVYVQFLTSVIGNERRRLSREQIAAAAELFPNSGRVQARFADSELAQLSETMAHEEAVARAEAAAVRAVQLLPWDYGMRLYLATAREMKGDRAGAEEALRAAVRLAPNYTEVHWRLANMLLRVGKFEQSLAEFRRTVETDPLMLPVALSVVWSASDGDFAAVNAITGEMAQTRLGLASFLLNQARIPEAAQVFSQIDRAARLTLPEAGAFLDALLAAGEVELSYRLWLDVMGSAEANKTGPWNGGFETKPIKGLTQFDWTLSSSDYAQVVIDPTVAHTGTNSLRIAFTGRDTTRLEREVWQIIKLRPGTAYRLGCYVKTENLLTPEGPRVMLITQKGATVAASDPIAAGSRDWQPVSLNFTAPPDASFLMLAIRRIPRYSYDDPTRGIIWFDDFSIWESRDAEQAEHTESVKHGKDN